MRRAGALIACGLLGLMGCFAPDGFDARLSVQDDGRIQFVYEGRLTHLPSAMERAAGRPIAEREATIADQMRRDTRLRRVASLGEGVFAVEYITTTRIELGETLVFPPAGEPWLTVVRGRDGVVRVAARRFSADEARALRSLGVGLAGRLTLSTGGAIDGHNGELDGGEVAWVIAGPETPAPNAVIVFPD